MIWGPYAAWLQFGCAACGKEQQMFSFSKWKKKIFTFLLQKISEPVIRPFLKYPYFYLFTDRESFCHLCHFNFDVAGCVLFGSLEQFVPSTLFRAISHIQHEAGKPGRKWAESLLIMKETAASPPFKHLIWKRQTLKTTFPQTQGRLSRSGKKETKKTSFISFFFLLWFYFSPNNEKSPVLISLIY